MEYLNTETFITKSRIVHNNFYDYSKTIFTGKNKKLIITCPIHGDFEQTANSHLNGHKCKKCSIEQLKLKKLKDLFSSTLKQMKVYYIQDLNFKSINSKIY